jgi:primosomal protein N' (replication factor Y)
MPSMIEKYNLKTVDVLRLFLPSSMRLNKVKPVFLEYVFLNKEVVIDEVINSLQKNANKQKELLLYLKKTNEEEKVKLNKQFGSVVVNKFLVLEVLKSRQIEVKRTPKTSFSENAKQNLTLTKAQQNAVSSVIKSTNKTFLLHGVTGSGKTEVYMQVISHYLTQNKTAIMLVPEIALTPQLLKNFRARFQNQVAILHSGLSDGERFDEWRRIKENDAKIVVGARSAIFAPIENLGVIIIDEEQ